MPLDSRAGSSGQHGRKEGGGGEEAAEATRNASSTVLLAGMLTLTLSAAGYTHLASSESGSSGSGSNLPTYTRAQVAAHNNPTARVWVTYRDGVYDVTDFVALHPGGNKIMLAAGGAVDPYWKLYAQHGKDYVLELLSRYKIGQLDPNEAADIARAAAASGDPYASDPQRHPALVARSMKPYNGETPNELLTDQYLTPQELLFTRNHLPVPHVDEEKYTLTIEGLPPASEGETTSMRAFTLADLRNASAFSPTRVVAAIQCAGNRRAGMSRAKPARGLDWEVGAIGNGEWGGVRLRDVLLSLGVKEEDIGTSFSHVRFEGLDRDPSGGAGYSASIPADIAMDPSRPVLLAWEYNGQPLTKDHGYPLRVVVPGVVAARQVKWLGKISLAKEESESVWQRKDYKAFPQYQDWDTVDYDSMPALQDMPVNSAITEPKDGSVVGVTSEGATQVTVKGWAWSGAGRAITRVDVSPDGGKTWLPTTITARPPDSTPSLRGSWGWTLWEAEVPVPDHLRTLLASRRAAAASVQSRLVLPPSSPPPASLEPVTMTLAVKAIDSACNTQPESPLGIWNYRGITNNSWNKVTLELK